MKKFDVIVVGNGLVGVVTALCLAKHLPKLKIALLGPQLSAGQSKVQRVIAVNDFACQLLADIGVSLALLKKEICYYDKMRVWDSQSSGVVEFAAADLRRQYLGVIVPHESLLKIMGAALKNVPQIQPVEGLLEQIQGNDQDQYELTLESGICLTAPFIVAADGANSKVSQRVGLSQPIKSYQQLGCVATIQTDQPHQSTAYQRFLPGGPMAYLPLANSNHCSIVWSIPSGEGKNLLQLSQAQQAQRISAGLGDHLGAVKLLSPIAQFPLGRRQLPQIVQKGIALVGDAAHVIHPLAGQGANLGFFDASMLVRELVQGMTEGRPLGSLTVLKRYQQKSQAKSHAMSLAMTGLNQLFKSHHTGVRQIRGWGLDRVNHIDPLKKFFVENALGTH